MLRIVFDQVKPTERITLQLGGPRAFVESLRTHPAAASGGPAVPRASLRLDRICFGPVERIAALYTADEAAFPAKLARLRSGLQRVETQVRGPFFDEDFRLVDAAFAPMFRYVEVFAHLGLDLDLARSPRLGAWQQALAARPSVKGTVGPDYHSHLTAFLQSRTSHLGHLARAMVDPLRMSG